MMRKAELLAALLAITAVSAAADGDDPPSRVARLNYQSGSVSFRPGSVEEWAAATLNYPLTTGDHLWTDAGAQSEIHVGSTAIRMAPETAMSILNLDDQTVQLSVTQGSVNVHIRDLADGESFEVDTPNMSATLLRPGDYRIDADGDRNVTVVTVHVGEAEVTGGGPVFQVHTGESARITGLDTVSQEVAPAAAPGDFDGWCAARDRHEDQAQTSANYVPRDMAGYEDLDEHGVWREDAQYGWIWAPRTVPVGWAPYHYGHWAWVEPWGWTWIDDAPWGFAPFHYGRWALVAGGWVWAPGRTTIGVRPVYAPALVVFVGGPRFGVGIGAGGGGVAAWFPLGPGEAYRPAYRVSEVYARRMNVHATSVNVTNVRYANQNVRGAVIAVSNETFASARPVRQGSLRVDAREVEQAQVVGTTAQIAPRRESVLAGTGPAAAAPPVRYTDRIVVARKAPPPPPVSFAAKRQALEANQGRPLEPQQIITLRNNSPAARPMVRTPTPAAGRSIPENQRPVNPRPPAGTPIAPRTDRPVEQVERPAVIERRVPETRRMEPPRVERPVVETPAVVERRAPETRRVEPPRVEQPRTERPAVVERRAPEARREEQPRTERPAVVERRAPESRREAGDKPKEAPAKPGRKAEQKKDDK